MTAASDPSVPMRPAALLGWYVALTTVVVLIRGAATLAGGPAWLIASMPWPEVFYGPAIAVACIFGVPRLAARIEVWLKARKA